MNIISKQEFKAIFKDIHTKSSDTRFCFILGAGASFSSGIKTGMQLAEIWYKELKEEVLTKSEFEKWKADKKIDENNLGYYYGIIYHRRFENHKQSGYDYLNNIMQHAQPSFGYTVLAQLLSSTRHNVIITTNFDDLTEQALYYYTEKRPLVCGHENLALFAKPSQERPLIIKIHRDLLLNPMSEPNEIGELKTEWTNTLDTIFKNFIPVFIGYGGNDGSLMNYLSKVDKFENLFWMKRKGDAVNSTIEKLLDDKDGKLVEIEGFDEIMYDLLMSTDIKLIGEEIINNAHKRRNKYDEQVIDIRKKIEKSGEESEEDRLDFKAKAENSDLVKAYLEIENEKDIDKKEALYKKAIDTYKEEPMFYNNYANFLYEQRKDFDTIEINYKKAIALNPEYGDLYYNYAIFLKVIRKDYNAAEINYKKAISLNPENGSYCYNYANFLYNQRKDYEAAETYYKKAIALNPEKGDFYGNYALFLKDIREDYDTAEINYKKAIALNPEKGYFYGNYATFLKEIRKDYDTAETYYKKAITLNPENGDFYNIYAIHLNDIKKDYNKAENNYKKAIALNPEDGDFYSNYAIFLKDIRKEYDTAEINFKKAIELDSENGIYNGNYAQLLLEKGDKINGKIYLDKAFSLCDMDELLSELWFYRFAHFPETSLEAAAKELDKLIEKGVKTLYWNFEGNIQQAIKDKHPQPEKLRYYADKLSKE